MGLSLKIKYLIINLDGSAEEQYSGPNFRPEVQGYRTCPSIEDGGFITAYDWTDATRPVTVTVDGATKLLNAFAVWVGLYSPPPEEGDDYEYPGLWHLFTDCLPAPGTVGLATLGDACLGQSKKMFLQSKFPTEECSDANPCTYRFLNGTRAVAKFDSTTTPSCPEGWPICAANTGVTSYTSNTWRTFAHEGAPLRPSPMPRGRRTPLWLTRRHSQCWQWVTT